MAVTKLSNSGIKTGVLKYDSMLAGNPAYSPQFYDSIATAVGNDTSQSIIFSSIPQTYRHLQLRMTMRVDGTSTGGIDHRYIMNNDTATNYSHGDLIGSGGGGAVGVNYTATQAYIRVDNTVMGGGQAAGLVSIVVADIFDYSGSRWKLLKEVAAQPNASTFNRITYASGVWRSTSAITQIEIRSEAGNWSSLARFDLYGIKD